MATGALDQNLDLVCVGEERAFADPHQPGRQVVPEVQPEHGLRLRIGKGAVGQHHRCPAGGLLGRLKDEANFAGELIPKAGQHPRHGQQDRGMPIVPAGVHHARIARGVGGVALLLNRQPVDVGSQRDHPTAAPGQAPDHAGPPDPLAHLESQFAEAGRHHARRSSLLERELRIGMKVAPQRDQVVRRLRDQPCDWELGVGSWELGTHAHHDTRPVAPLLKPTSIPFIPTPDFCSRPLR